MLHLPPSASGGVSLAGAATAILYCGIVSNLSATDAPNITVMADVGASCVQAAGGIDVTERVGSYGQVNMTGGI